MYIQGAAVRLPFLDIKNKMEIKICLEKFLQQWKEQRRKFFLENESIQVLNIIPGRWRPLFCTHCVSLFCKFSLTRRNTNGVIARISVRILSFNSCIVSGRVAKILILNSPTKSNHKS